MKLRELRRSEGLTQEQLVERCSVKQDTISAIENGRHQPSLYLMTTIAKALGYRVEVRLVKEHSGVKP